ncbi:MAG: hypothetical protein VW907_05095, partial [Opitutae bacterium]
LQTSADQRAGQALESDLATAALQRTLSRSADARAQDLAAQDILNAIFGRQMQGAANTRADQALQSDLYGMVGDQQTLSGDANQRAQQMLMDALFGRVGGEDTLTGEAAARAEAAQTRDFRDSDIVQLLAASEAGLVDKEIATNRILEALGLSQRLNLPPTDTTAVGANTIDVTPEVFRDIDPAALEQAIQESIQNNPMFYRDENGVLRFRSNNAPVNIVEG